MGHRFIKQPKLFGSSLYLLIPEKLRKDMGIDFDTILEIVQISDKSFVVRKVEIKEGEENGNITRD
ncbi:MAG: hypothetical protein DRJ18_00280 [Candidatus Methanomethylicota archaeon]|nr:MAG: hypothetical protein DRJ18_00280 [Candidatus Verstraetearchaeota archaeon]